MAFAILPTGDFNDLKPEQLEKACLKMEKTGYIQEYITDAHGNRAFKVYNITTVYSLARYLEAADAERPKAARLLEKQNALVRLYTHRPYKDSTEEQLEEDMNAVISGNRLIGENSFSEPLKDYVKARAYNFRQIGMPAIETGLYHVTALVDEEIIPYDRDPEVAYHDYMRRASVCMKIMQSDYMKDAPEKALYMNRLQIKAPSAVKERHHELIRSNEEFREEIRSYGKGTEEKKPLSHNKPELYSRSSS